MDPMSFLKVAMFAFNNVEAINVEPRQFVDLFSLPRSSRAGKFVDSGVKRSEEEEEEEEVGECCDSSTN